VSHVNQVIKSFSQSRESQVVIINGLPPFNQALLLLREVGSSGRPEQRDAVVPYGLLGLLAQRRGDHDNALVSEEAGREGAGIKLLVCRSSCRKHERGELP
jgi:hypothetical protein